MKLLSIAAVAPALLLTAAYAPEGEKPSAKPSKACFNFSQVTTFKTLDADTIRIETDDAKAFDLDLTGPKCSPLDKAGELSIKTAPAFGLCAGVLGRGRIAFQSPTSTEPITCTIAKLDIAAAEPAKPK